MFTLRLFRSKRNKLRGNNATEKEKRQKKQKNKLWKTSDLSLSGFCNVSSQISIIYSRVYTHDFNTNRTGKIRRIIIMTESGILYPV